MKKSMKHIYALLLGALAPGLLVSCVADAPEEAPSPSAESSFNVIASIAREVKTKAYQEQGYVLEGIYNLTYPTLEGTYDVASVNFNLNESITPGIGIVTVGDNQDLKWIDVGGGSTPTFYLDNMMVENADPNPESPLDITFGSDNPYKAGLFDFTDGSNDLLWGSSMVGRGSKTVNVDLHHNMARIRVQVTVDRTNMTVTNNLDIEKAKVEITSINQTPISYNRITGDLQLDTLSMEAYTPLTLVNPATDGKIEWGDSIISEEDPNIATYITQDFVVPPQGLLGDESRPRLQITMPDGQMYTGILPHAMEILDDTHSAMGYPAALYFLKEHILTIRTVITEEPPTLEFMPVWVVKWVDKGEFDIEAHQAGIYTAAEFYKLIEYYQTNNEYQLVRYGSLDEDDDTGYKEWNFNFFSGVTLEYSDIYNTMHPGTLGSQPFHFTYNGYGATVVNRNDPGVEKKVNEQQLYRIVTGSLSWNSLN